MRACTSIQIPEHGEVENVEIQIPEHGEVENVEKESLSTETPFRGAEANQTLAASLQSQEHLVALSQKLLDQLAPRLGNVERSTFCDWVRVFFMRWSLENSELLRSKLPAHSLSTWVQLHLRYSTQHKGQPLRQHKSIPAFSHNPELAKRRWILALTLILSGSLILPSGLDRCTMSLYGVQWSSMESRYMHQAMPEFYNRPSSCPPNSTPSQV